MKKCLIIGAAMLDILVRVDQLPRTGEDVYAHSQEMSVGGCAYNVVDIIKRFDVPYTLFAPLGAGIYADFIATKLKEAGHESPIHALEQDNGYCLCMIESDGERTFLTLPGIETSFKKEWFNQINPEEYESVYICGYEIEGEGGDAIIEFLERHKDLIVYYAPGPRITHISKEKNKQIFALTPILHLNEAEALHFTGELNYDRAAEKLYQWTNNMVIVTLGAAGVYLYDGKGILIESQKVKVVDTIGAGDSHIGAIIAMRYLGSEYEEAVCLANKVSALVVGTKGATLTTQRFTRGGF